MEKKFSQATIKAGSIDEKNFTIDFIMTIETKDRHGDMVDVASIKIANFMKNPVVLPQHDHSSPAIGIVLETWVEKIDGMQALVGKVKFAVEEYDLARTYWNLYSNGYMKAVSIGFFPERAEMVNDVFVLYGAEIIELSCVSIPANQLALAKSAGIDIKPLLSNSAILKDIRDSLISLKNLIDEPEEKETVETPSETDEELHTDTTDEHAEPKKDIVEVPVVEDQKSIARKKYINVLNKAIRQLL